jgi:hypothetical protein
MTAAGLDWRGEAHVVRCRVSAIPKERGVRYRAGLSFANPVETIWLGPPGDEIG